jgi:hypothetical protein
MGGEVNAGIGIFFGYEVMFDIRHSKVGFAPIAPKP